MPMTSQEKMAAHREREKEARSASAAEDAYVAREVAVTQHLLTTGQLQDVSTPNFKDVKAEGVALHRLEKSEAYARWRWEGVRSGEVAYL